MAKNDSSIGLKSGEYGGRYINCKLIHQQKRANQHRNSHQQMLGMHYNGFRCAQVQRGNEGFYQSKVVKGCSYQT
jgi:hypothetical protein